MYYQQQLCRPSSSETVLEGAERLQVKRDLVPGQYQDTEDESVNFGPSKDNLTRYSISLQSTVHPYTLQLNHAPFAYKINVRV